MSYALTDLLRFSPGDTALEDVETAGTPGFDGGKRESLKALKGMGEELADLQERLFANAYTGGSRRVLVVLQGMDTSGKGGVIDHALALLPPSGLRVTSFKKPTEEELSHDFLWRIERALPTPGLVGAFDRSHYEDVLAARLHQTASEEEIERRYGAINDFEKGLVDDGTVVLKCFLHLSEAEQEERLRARLEDPEKQWKFKPSDIDERARWDDYQRVYALALERCHTEAAPWYVVPSDKKWYRNWAVGQLLLEALRGMRLEWPEASYDVEEQKARLTND